MRGAVFILDDPIFHGLSIFLIFGILGSTCSTLVFIATLYYAAYRHRFASPENPDAQGARSMTSWQTVRFVAGSFVPLSLAVGIPGRLMSAGPSWLAFAASVGVNRLQSALTRWCRMESILRKRAMCRGC